ncbi:GMC family oxidoreductase [Bosea sp. (in: a-proteobacteria)]|uniref:GMC family oxidoreductase n=1 Tax=Bosea sp. (in: a-proteobacteria) TaxID=1871050 RepID=UPI00261D89BC|nr:GMC family oxidoreductase N-terminal domain-containing protein [Bosea sp. (in: a-proteobacteria)]MCO5091214.1 GMC family oxidoreductase N-terminal domain-containing protein [Bosea sp. (in: a-proteobacteria)]
MQYTHLIVGGGSAGCALAARLSEDAGNNVCLLEAGPDFAPDRTPADILDTYAGMALSNPAYVWSGLKIRRGDGPYLTQAARQPINFEQGRVIGGGSSINGQVALRGAEDDFDRWDAAGATGWDWHAVLPYFRRLESDRDFVDQWHGNEGPIPVRRFPREQWDDYTLSVGRAWESQGYRYLPDMNGEFAEGYASLPLSNDGERRISAALGYLTREVRARRNLTVMGDAQAARIRFEGRRAVAVELLPGASGPGRLEARTIIVASGALHTPQLLMLSGIGPAEQLARFGIDVLVDRQGVGRNLQDHPSISISGYLRASVRKKHMFRRNYSYLRYSSGFPGCDDIDMVMMSVCRSAWHALGGRIGTLSTLLGKPHSRGWVGLASPDPSTEPEVCFNWLDDDRDRLRMMDAFRRMAVIARLPVVAKFLEHPFPSSYSERVRQIGRKTPVNIVLTGIAAALMDSGRPIRDLMIEHVIRDGPSLDVLLGDDGKLATHVVSEATSAWHPCGTCKMGRADDPMSVTDPHGKVFGTENLYVADASIMPEIPRTNLNLPSIMIGERVADLLRQAA